MNCPKLAALPFPSLGGWLWGLLLGATACTHESLAPPNLDPDYVSSPCSPDSAYFVRDVLPLLSSNCAMSGCHDATTRAEGIRLDHYKAVIQTGEVRAGDPNQSELLEVCLETRPDKRMPPPPRSPLSPAQIETLRRWIAQGARNNDCTDL